MKRITAIMITLVMLLAASCTKNTNEPANTTAGTTAETTVGEGIVTEETTAVTTTATTVGQGLAPAVTETAATEVTTDINAMLEGYTVYEVTTEHVMLYIECR